MSATFRIIAQYHQNQRRSKESPGSGSGRNGTSTSSSHRGRAEEVAGDASTTTTSKALSDPGRLGRHTSVGGHGGAIFDGGGGEGWNGGSVINNGNGSAGWVGGSVSQCPGCQAERIHRPAETRQYGESTRVRTVR